MGRGIVDSAIAMLSITPFLSGFSLYRYALKPCETAHTAWLFCVDRQLAIKAGGFDQQAYAYEDFAFNQRLIQLTGKPMLIYPDFPIYYQPRSTLQGLLRQYFKYGFARARSTGVVKSKYRDLLFMASPLTLLSISTLYAGALIATPVTYLASLIFILICNIIAFAADRLHALRNRGLSRPGLHVLITALLLSPLVAAVPSLARSCGSLWYLARSNRVSNPTLLP
jgi:succinoglycan biosynthesis protein ExoA